MKDKTGVKLMSKVIQASVMVARVLKGYLKGLAVNHKKKNTRTGRGRVKISHEGQDRCKINE